MRTKSDLLRFPMSRETVPEFIFMESVVNNNIRMYAVLNVVTCQNGDIKTLHRSEGLSSNSL